ncbi:hypothetical protein GCM10023189_26320 [Nibrella saemangeumensis]|uniref:DUF4398 domain-containing protein n=1 Tax=Nibrella saemangeumensis TaxID=1084526 RepID=A0ABP8MYS7_9BACT
MRGNLYLTGLMLVIGSLSARAQTVYAGEQTVEKNKLPGLFLTIPLDSKVVEREWQNQLKSWGRLVGSRGVYKVSSADIPPVSSEPINLVSQVKSGRNSTTIFASFDLGAANYLTVGNGKYREAEQLLKDFADKVSYSEELRLVQQSFDEAQKNHQKVVRTGEKLLRDIERNKKDKEALLRRIEENGKELEQLEKDIVMNKTDQSNALTEVENRKKAVEAVKAKRGE